MPLLLCLLLAAATPDDERVAVPVAVGVGAAFGGVGVHIEGAWRHLALFAGGGLNLRNNPVDTQDHGVAFAGGMRLFTGIREGAMVSLHGTTSSMRCCESEGTAEFTSNDEWAFGASAGWRYRDPSGLFAELAVGPLSQATTSDGRAPTLQNVPRQEGCGADGERWHCFRRRLIVDVNLALGFEF